MFSFIARAIVSLFTTPDRQSDARIRKSTATKAAGIAYKSGQEEKRLTNIDIGDLRTEGKTFLKGQRAALGFSGVDIHQGSALDVRNRSIGKLGADIGRVQAAGDIKFNTFMTEYANYKAAAGVESTDWWSNFLAGL